METLDRKQKVGPEHWKKDTCIRERRILGDGEYISASGNSMQKNQDEPCDFSNFKN